MLHAPVSGDDQKADIERVRYRGLASGNVRHFEVSAGFAKRISVSADTIVSITNVDGGAPVLVTGLIDDERNFTVAPFDLPELTPGPIDGDQFDAREMQALARSRDTSLAAGRAVTLFDRDTAPGEIFLMKLPRDADLFVIAPLERTFISAGGGGR
ncbi:MAG: aminomethyltransferase, partial [Pseudomonadota bacterium]